MEEKGYERRTQSIRVDVNFSRSTMFSISRPLSGWEGRGEM